MDEARKAIALLDAGESLETSDTYKNQKATESIWMLNEFATRNGKKVIVIDPHENVLKERLNGDTY